jgi:hypothetical protein
MLMFDTYLRRFCTAAFRFGLNGDHVPRLKIDDVIFQRETWRLTAPEVAKVKIGTERFLRMRAWKEEKGLPRQVFVRYPAEPKPMHLDFDSPLSVENSVSHIRKMSLGERMSISEMLPLPEQMWLEDAQGRRYSSEFRLLAVDPVRWSPYRH